MGVGVGQKRFHCWLSLRVVKAAVAFQPLRAGLAVGIARSTADLPTLGGERGIVDPVAAFQDIVQQAIGGGFGRLSSQRGSPLGPLLPGRFMPRVLEGMQ